MQVLKCVLINKFGDNNKKIHSHNEHRRDIVHQQYPKKFMQPVSGLYDCSISSIIILMV